MTTFGGNIKENGLGKVLLHELGHNMGQVYSDKSVDKTFGRPAIKSIPGIPFPEAVPVGIVYGEHGHAGTHCASGLSSVTKKMSDYQKEKAFKEHTCIMFGSSDMQSNKLYEYCDKCITYIRAEDLCDIRKDWS